MYNIRGDAMKIRFAGSLVVIMLLCLPICSFGAEAVKLRHAASVYFDSKGNGVRLSEGVACNESATFMVADTGHGRLLRYTFQDDMVKGGEEIKIDQMSYPVRLQLNAGGEIFALDGKQRRIIHISPDGAFKGFITPSGTPDASPLVPRSFKLDSAGNIYILDIFSGRVLVLDPTGKYIRHVDFPGKGGSFSDLAVDTRGTIFILDSADAVVYSAAKDAKEFSPMSQKLEQYVNFPTAIAVDSRGTIYLADQNGSGVVLVGPDGSFLGRSLVFGWKDGLLRYPAQLCLNEKGEFFVADRENSRVQIFKIIR
jgi:sugar lactone lactonase YvrE